MLFDPEGSIYRCERCGNLRVSKVEFLRLETDPDTQPRIHRLEEALKVISTKLDEIQSLARTGLRP